MIKKLLLSMSLLLICFSASAQSYLESGNRYVSGEFVLERATKYIVNLDYVPVRVKAVLNGKVPVIYSQDSDGKIYKTTINGESKTELTSMSGNPHSEIYTDPLPDDASRLSAPVMSRYGLLYINQYGDLRAGDKTFAVNATDDNQIAVYGKYAVVLTHPTSHYPHGALGDRIESAGFAVVDLADGKVIGRRNVTDIGVIEQKGALLADLNSDGEPEIVVTVSSSSVGAQVYAFSPEGEIRFISDPIGKSFRWRHVFAAARFDGGFVRVVNVITPHIGGTLEFLEAVNGKLIRKSAISGVSTHNFGSANLGMGLTVDVDGDGLPEALVPDDTKTKITAYSSMCKVIELAEMISFKGKLSSEITAVSAGEEVKLIAFGTDAKELYVYLK